LFVHVYYIFLESTAIQEDAMNENTIEVNADIENSVFQWIIGTMNVGIDTWETMSVTEKQVEETIVNIRVNEKDQMTERLSRLEGEERNLNMDMKALKLGQWNLANQSGFREYNDEFYDRQLGDMREQFQRDQGESVLTGLQCELYGFRYNENQNENQNENIEEDEEGYSYGENIEENPEAYEMDQVRGEDDDNDENMFN